MVNRLAYLFVSSVALLACEDDGGTEGATPSSCQAPEGERGTPECHRYHAQYCALVLECGVQNHCECVDDASSIACISDAEATRCADELENATCSGPPEGCGLLEIVDRDVAMAGCDQYIATVCDFRARCHGVDPVECMTEGHASVDCSMAVGLSPDFDRCLAEVAALDCSETGTPASCDGVVRREG